ncbi:hypothetical protein JCM3775_003115 [Rhodotorula graminis]
MSRNDSQGLLKRTTSTGAYGINLDEPSPPRTVPAIYLPGQGREWSPQNMFVPDPNSLRRHMLEKRRVPRSSSSLHLAERAHRALGLERQLATSPTRSSADHSRAHRKAFVNLSDEDGSHSETDTGKAPADSSPDSDSDDDSSSSGDEGLAMNARPPLGRSKTWAHGGVHEPPRASRSHSSGGSSSDDDDDGDALTMAPVRRSFTAPGRSSSSAAVAPASTSRKTRPPPLKKDAFVPHPRDGPKSPTTTGHDNEPAFGRISSPVNEQSKRHRRRSFDKALRRGSRR